MSLADLPNWREGVADPDLHSAPPSNVDEAVSADLGHGIHLFRSPIDHDFSIDELQAAVKSMRASTAPGPDSISVPLLSHAGPAVFEALLNIFNSSWQFGIIPKEWKKANAFAIFKKGDQSDPSSYRLISITSVIMRLFERMVLSRLVEHHSDFLSKNQAGFRKQHSTLDNIYRLLRDVHSQLRKRKMLPVLFLDIVKAFDRVPHSYLLSKLYSEAGIRGKAWGGFARFWLIVRSGS